MMYAACPAPSFEIEPEVNHAILLDPFLLEPRQGETLLLDLCPDSTKRADIIDFKLADALEDIDGDALGSCWYFGLRPFRTRDSQTDLTFDPCLYAASMQAEKVYEIRVFVSDRPLECEVTQGAQPTHDVVLEPGAHLLEFVWQIPTTTHADPALQDLCCPDF